jgi:hypothetical protein
MLYGEKTIRKAIMETKIAGDKIIFGPLGELKVQELLRYNKSLLYPTGRHFTDLALLLMRSRLLKIIRIAVELSRNDVPPYVRARAIQIKYEALITLKNIDERLFNVKYALYDVL